MYMLIIFSVIFLLAATYTAMNKLSSYKDETKSVWADGDSVLIRRNDKDNPHKKENFMIRLQ